MNQIVILAGGLATRLKPLSNSVPKCMIEILGRPFIDWQLKLLKSQDISEVVLCVSYRAEQVIDYVQDGSKFGLKIKYSLDGEAQLGTGGALINARELLNNIFFVIYGDSYLNINFEKVKEMFKESSKLALMTYCLNDDPNHKNNVEPLDEYRIAYNKNAPKADLKYIDFGLSMMHKSVLSEYTRGSRVDLSQIFMNLSDKSQLAGYESKNKFFEIGSYDGIEELTSYLAKGSREFY